MKAKRKIVQLLLQPAAGGYHECIVALCDDGSTWCYWKALDHKWEQCFPKIPQDGEKT
jgi:hypothetical protein